MDFVFLKTKLSNLLYKLTKINFRFSTIAQIFVNR